MTEPSLSFGVRLALAWKILSDGVFAARMSTSEKPAEPVQVAASDSHQLHAAQPDSALQLLGLLQQEGRFIDFLQEDVSLFSDAEIGGAARVVHQGCRRVLDEQITIEPISTQDEGSPLVLEGGFNASEYRLSGNVVGQAPFQGTLTHRGWRAAAINLPKVADGHDVTILAPAEIEL